MKNNIVKPILGLLSILSVAATSCSKETGTGTTVTSSSVTEFKKGDEFIKLSYNVDGTIQKATIKTDVNTNGSTVEYNVLYNANKKMSEMTSVSGEKIVPVYSTNNQLDKADIFIGTEKSGSIQYEYQNNLLSKATLTTKLTGSTFIPIMEFRFTYNTAGNVSKVATFMPGSLIPTQLVPAGYVEFTYDNKTNPLYVQKDFLSLLMQPASKNNVIQEKHYDENNVLDDEVNYTYTYNSLGLPTAAVVKSGLPNQPVTTTNLSITYK